MTIWLPVDGVWRTRDKSASVIQLVPPTSTIRPFGSEVAIAVDEHDGLEADSAAQCQHIRSVSVDRVEAVEGMWVEPH